MDNPGISLFQGTEININNSQNNEEEEDLEDQIRRKEELQDLLHANLDDFKYDDSTINSSTNISTTSAENVEGRYKDAITPSEQLKVLYDVRVREIHALKEEYDKYRRESVKEIEALKQRNTLLEAEQRQLKISLNNAELLLVEKTEAINNLNNVLQLKDGQIENLEKLKVQNETDLITYQSELTELHIKLQAQNGPFNLNAKYNSEQYQKSLQEKIDKFESALEEEYKKSADYHKDKQILQEEIQRLVVEKLDLEKDNNSILNALDNAQSQCRDLVDLAEILRKESDHFKERLHQIETSRGENLDFSKQESFMNEKLRKMLLDKSVEMDALKIKLRYYEKDLVELLEYRQLKTDVYKKEFQKCDNPSHTKDLLLMQNDLQNYRRIIDDKNQQILNLNSNNRDLKEKIEEMLLQTRNEIQNISSKYNVPKLEIMSKELEKAENTVKMLSEKLEESEERRLSLLKKLKPKSDKIDTELLDELEKCKNELSETEKLLINERDQKAKIFKDLEYSKNQILTLKNQLEELKILKSPTKTENNFGDQSVKAEYEQLKNQIMQVMHHLEKNNNSKNNKENPELITDIKQRMDQFMLSTNSDVLEKEHIEQQINSWKKLLDEVTLKDAEEILKSQYKEALVNLHSANEKLKVLEDTVQELQNAVTVADGEKCRLDIELKETVKKLENAENTCRCLENEIKQMKSFTNEKNKEIKESNIVSKEADLEYFKKQLEEAKSQLQNKELEITTKQEKIKQIQQEKHDLKKYIDKLKTELNKLKNEKRILENELTEAHNIITPINQSKKFNDEEIQTTLETSNKHTNDWEFNKHLNEELIKAELKLRDEIQVEYQKRINDIEKRYQNSYKEVSDLCRQQEEKLEQQEHQYREYLKMVFKECEKCTKEVENEKTDLVRQLTFLKEEFDKYKNSVVVNEEKYLKMLKKMEKDSQKNIEAWKKWSKKIVYSCLDIEATNKKVRDKVLASLHSYDEEIAVLQKAFDAKIEKKLKKKT